LRLKVGRGISW